MCIIFRLHWISLLKHWEYDSDERDNAKLHRLWQRYNNLPSHRTLTSPQSLTYIFFKNFGPNPSKKRKEKRNQSQIMDNAKGPSCRMWVARWRSVAEVGVGRHLSSYTWTGYTWRSEPRPFVRFSFLTHYYCFIDSFIQLHNAAYDVRECLPQYTLWVWRSFKEK